MSNPTTRAQFGSSGSAGSNLHSTTPTLPFPKWQMFVLALCRISEPIAFMSIFPYIYFMVEDFHVTQDKTKISLYAGLITSAFTFAEFSTGLIWGRLSDKIGRKPVLLMGLAGTGLSVLIFGFAPNINIALFARALGGLLNGNIGVLQTTVAELITVKEHQPRAYAIMPLVWCFGSIIGPIIGGTLARPRLLYPDFFPADSIWERYPYLLPNLFSAVVVLFGLLIGLLFSEETHVEKKNRRDRGIELGDYLLNLFSRRSPDQKRMEATLLLSRDEQPPRYSARENSPPLSYTAVPDVEARPLLDSVTNKFGHQDTETETQHTATPNSTVIIETETEQKTFTRPVVLNIISYGILAFHTMTFDQLFPVFLSTESPEHPQPTSLPFKFVDGFGLSQNHIAMILSVQGIYSMVSTILFFPLVVHRVGTLQLFRFLMLSYFLLYFSTPYLVLLPKNLQMVGIYVIIIWKCTFSTMAYPSNAMLLTNSALTTKTLGTINGVAASIASLCRAFGPTVSGFLFAIGLSTGYSGLAWWCTGLVSIVGACVSLHVSEPKGRLDKTSED